MKKRVNFEEICDLKETFGYMHDFEGHVHIILKNFEIKDKIYQGQ